MSVRSNSGLLGGGVVRRDVRRPTLPQGKLVENKCEKKRWLGKAEGRNSVVLHKNKEATSSLSPTTPGNANKSDIPRSRLKQGRLVLGSQN